MKEMKDSQILFLGKHIPSFHSICLSVPRDFKLVCSSPGRVRGEMGAAEGELEFNQSEAGLGVI